MMRRRTSSAASLIACVAASCDAMICWNSRFCCAAFGARAVDGAVLAFTPERDVEFGAVGPGPVLGAAMMPSNSVEADETFFWEGLLAADGPRVPMMPRSSVDAGEIFAAGGAAAVEGFGDAMIPKSSVEGELGFGE